jgi:hypothetical protein
MVHQSSLREVPDLAASSGIRSEPALEAIMCASILPEDSALLPFSGAVLYNNVYGKGDIADYR